MTVSIIVSVFNEFPNIREVYRQIVAVLSELSLEYELIFVDDGSKDDSFGIVKSICEENSRVVAVKLSRNFGHEYAMQAGLGWAKGDIAILMDADLQHPPAVLPDIIQKLKDYDVVFCRRMTYRTTFFKRATSWLFYRFFNLFSNIAIIPDASDFIGLRARVVTTLKSFPERDRFLRGLLRWSGFSNTCVFYDHQRRAGGESKYGFIKLLELTLDSLLSFSNNPLRKLAVVGLSIAVISFAYGMYVVVLFIFYNAALIPGWATIVVSVLFLGGINLVALSLLGEYLARIYNEIKQRPLFLVDMVIDSRVGASPHKCP